MSIVKSHSKDQSNLHNLTYQSEQYTALHLVQWSVVVGNITEMLSDEDDVKVTFNHHCGTAPTFCWPHRETICSVPTENVLSVVGIFALITARNITISSDIADYRKTSRDVDIN